MHRVIAAVAVLVAVAVLLVVPLHPEAGLLAFLDAVTPHTSAMRRLDWVLVESGGNFVVFALVGGAAFALVRRARFALTISCLLSITAESIQLLVPSRVASWTDLITNWLGAAMGVGGAVFVERLIARRRAAAEGRASE